jgi:hypothetical protein
LPIRSTENEDDDRDTLSPGVAEMRELCSQFQRSIAALASNDIAKLETSTAAQDGLVEKLQAFRTQPSDQQPSIKVSSSDLEELVSLTKVYASLLQRALRTTRLRAALCQTYRLNFPADSAPAAASGWSCEV